MKNGVTKNELYQLIGLLALAKNYRAKMDDIKNAIAETLQIEADSNQANHIDDAIWSDYTVDELLKRLEVGKAV